MKDKEKEIDGLVVGLGKKGQQERVTGEEKDTEILMVELMKDKEGEDVKIEEKKSVYV